MKAFVQKFIEETGLPCRSRIRYVLAESGWECHIGHKNYQATFFVRHQEVAHEHLAGSYTLKLTRTFRVQKVGMMVGEDFRKFVENPWPHILVSGFGEQAGRYAVRALRSSGDQARLYGKMAACASDLGRLWDKVGRRLGSDEMVRIHRNALAARDLL